MMEEESFPLPLCCCWKRKRQQAANQKAKNLREKRKEGKRRKERHKGKLTWKETFNTDTQRRKQVIGELPRFFGAYGSLRANVRRSATHKLKGRLKGTENGNTYKATGKAGGNPSDTSLETPSEGRRGKEGIYGAGGPYR